MRLSTRDARLAAVFGIALAVGMLRAGSMKTPIAGDLPTDPGWFFGTMVWAPALIAVGLWTVAYFLLRTRPDRQQNLLLGAALVSEGLVAITAAISAATPDPAMAYAFLVGNLASAFIMVAAYVAFLGTFETSIGRFFATTPMRFVTWLVAVTGPLVAIFDPTKLVAAATWTGQFWFDVPGPLGNTIFLALSVSGVIGFLVVAHAWYVTPAGPAKTTAAFLFFAFAARDLFWVAGPILINYILPVAGFDFYILAYALPLEFWFMVLLSYGILRHQVLDIDVRIHDGIQRTLIVGAFTVAFFIGSELLEQALDANGTVLGIAAAGVVALAFRPLNRGAAWFADLVVPAARVDAATRDARRHEVYQMALDEMMASGGLSPHEEQVLQDLRSRLGVEAPPSGVASKADS